MPHTKSQPAIPRAPDVNADDARLSPPAPIVSPLKRPALPPASQAKQGAPSQSDGPVMQKPPLPPFTEQTAAEKVRMAEDGWNSKNPEKVSLAYSPDSAWRNRASFLQGREEIIRFLKDKWNRELDYRLIKELWAFSGNRIAVRFAYEWRTDDNQWFRSYGNENWEFDENGLMQRRIASINDLRIPESERLFRWTGTTRPKGHKGLSELGL